MFRSRSVCYSRTACELCFGAGPFVTAEQCVSCVSEQVGLLQENGGCVSCVSEQVGSGSAILSLNVCLHRFHQSHWPKMLLWIGVPSSECE